MKTQRDHQTKRRSDIGPRQKNEDQDHIKGSI